MGTRSISSLLPLAGVAGVIFSGPKLFAAPPDYVKDIKPLLRNKCSSCHGAKKQKAKLRLDAGKFIHTGSKEGEVIVPGKATASELIVRVLSKEMEERTSTSEGINKPGRDHNWHGFTMWLAGAGVKGGQSVGATILHLIGLNHNKLTYFHQGLDQKLTGVTRQAQVVKKALA